MSAISHHAALIYTMVMVSAADNEMTDAEMRTMGETINFLPVFADYDNTPLTDTVAGCADLLDEDDGLESVFHLIKDAVAGQASRNGLRARLRRRRRRRRGAPKRA